MTAREAGRRAFQQGIRLDDNPYLRVSHEYDLWREGWLDERSHCADAAISANTPEQVHIHASAVAIMKTLA